MKHDNELRDVKCNRLIQRYTPNERTNHWITAISFILLAISGLAMFHPSMSWLYAILGDVLANREDRLPEIGKYNAGQKLLSFTMVACLLLLLASGIVIWRCYFSFYFPIEIIRVAAVVHAFAAFVLIVGIIVHIYAAIWIKGSVGAMKRGTVTYGWARKHHPRWFKELIGK
ncbi:Formate dehydrogenase O gamma subunit [Candidatus Paraburkholderia calva]|nr:Formate dehydrogenase O gamma subunit [Candidatus Paraburkholderia calva]